MGAWEQASEAVSVRLTLARAVLLGPAVIRRAVAARPMPAEERWMLAQPREVRQSYACEVLDAPGDAEVRTQIWMMRQPEAVRESYVTAVLEPRLSRA